MTNKITIAGLQQMKRDGRKIVGVVVYDYQMAQIVDRAGVDIVSVGDSVGMNMWGHESEREVTLDQMLLVCKAVRRGVTRALVSCDLPGGIDDVGGCGSRARERRRRGYGEGRGRRRKRYARSRAPESPCGRSWDPAGNSAAGSGHDVMRIVGDATLIEEAGASLLDFRHSGPVAGPAVTNAVSIPVIGGLGGGPWLDGRVRAVVNAIGYTAAALDDTADRYANVARISARRDHDLRGRRARGAPGPRKIERVAPARRAGPAKQECQANADPPEEQCRPPSSTESPHATTSSAPVRRCC